MHQPPSFGTVSSGPKSQDQSPSQKEQNDGSTFATTEPTVSWTLTATNGAAGSAKALGECLARRSAAHKCASGCQVGTTSGERTFPLPLTARLQVTSPQVATTK